MPIDTKNLIINGGELEEDEEVHSLVDFILDNKNDIYYIDPIAYEINFVIVVCMYYGDIDIDLDFDALIENCIYEHIMCSNAKKDILKLKELLDKQLEIELSILNSNKKIVLDVIDSIIGQIPSKTVLKNLIKKFEKADLSKFKELKKLYEFANSTK